MSVRAPGYAVRVTWDNLPGRPLAFPPSAHTHAWGDVTDKPSTFPPSPHTHAFADITQKPATYPPAPHMHAGLLTFIGNVTLSETLLLSLAVGMKRKDMAVTLAQGVAAIATGDKLLAVPNGTPTTGCEVVNAYPSATAGQVTLGYYTPLLGIGATYSIPVSLYRIS